MDPYYYQFRDTRARQLLAQYWLYLFLWREMALLILPTDTVHELLSRYHCNTKKWNWHDNQIIFDLFYPTNLHNIVFWFMICTQNCPNKLKVNTIAMSKSKFTKNDVINFVSVLLLLPNWVPLPFSWDLAIIAICLIVTCPTTALSSVIGSYSRVQDAISFNVIHPKQLRIFWAFTYSEILTSIVGAHYTIHCPILAQTIVHVANHTPESENCGKSQAFTRNSKFFSATTEQQPTIESVN